MWFQGILVPLPFCYYRMIDLIQDTFGFVILMQTILHAIVVCFVLYQMKVGIVSLTVSISTYTNKWRQQMVSLSYNTFVSIFTRILISVNISGKRWLLQLLQILILPNCVGNSNVRLWLLWISPYKRGNSK